MFGIYGTVTGTYCIDIIGTVPYRTCVQAPISNRIYFYGFKSPNIRYSRKVMLLYYIYVILSDFTTEKATLVSMIPPSTFSISN